MRAKLSFGRCFTSFLQISLFVLAANALAVAQSGRSTISGYVFDAQRRPIQRMQVELLNDYESVVRRVQTDGSGRFFFSGLGQGRFTIKVSPTGTDYEERTEEVEIYGQGVTGRPLSDNVQRDIYLRVRKSDLLVSTPGAVFAQEVPDAARVEYEKAVKDIEANNTENAVARLEKSVGIFPEYYLALEKLGVLYVSQGKYENASTVYTKVVAVNPRSFNGWYGLAYSDLAIKRVDGALEASKRAVSLNASSPEAVLFLGLALRQAKLYTEAEKSLKQADKLSKGNSADVHWQLALLYAHNLKRYSDAANELERYLKVRPESENREQVKKLIKQFRDQPQSSN